MQKNLSRKSKVINSNAGNNVKIQDFKKEALDKATKELDKIENEIEKLEQNNKN